MDYIHNLTIVIVTYRTDEKILTDCLNSIDPQVKILLVENSNNIEFKKKFAFFLLLLCRRQRVPPSSLNLTTKN